MKKLLKRHPMSLYDTAIVAVCQCKIEMKRKVLSLLTICIFIFAPLTHATAIDLAANFRLFGEVYKPLLGSGDIFLSFGFDSTGNTVLGTEIGRISTTTGGGAPISTGVLSALEIPYNAWGVVDIEFSIPFSMEVNQTASMFIGFNTDKIGNQSGTDYGVRTIFDFSDDIAFVGAPLGFSVAGQGLTLQSVTAVNGISLEELGLVFEFVPENTIMTAFATQFPENILKTAFGTDGSVQAFTERGKASVLLNSDMHLAYFGLNHPATTIFERVGASIGGGNNVRFVPLPAAFILYGIGLTVIGYLRFRLI